MKIVVTGASGYIGSALTKKLVAEGHEILLILRPSSSLELIASVRDKVTLFHYDYHLDALITCFKAFSPEVVCHVASLFIAEHVASEVDDLIDANIRFGLHLLQAMHEAGVKKLINTSTSWQYDEVGSYQPACLYASTKEAFENLTYFYHLADAFQVIHLVIYDTYGPHDPRKKLFSLFERAACSKVPVAMSLGEQQLDLVYIDDVVDAYLQALSLLHQKAIIFDHYALKSGRALSLRAIAALYESIMQVKLNISWGARAYRQREVMVPCAHLRAVPNWHARISLEEGLLKLKDTK